MTGRGRQFCAEGFSDFELLWFKIFGCGGNVVCKDGSIKYTGYYKDQKDKIYGLLGR